MNNQQHQSIYIKLFHLIALIAFNPAYNGDHAVNAQTCSGVLTETYKPNADVIIGFIGRRRLSSSNTSLCDVSDGGSDQLYEIAKIIVDNPPSSVVLPNVTVGLELYDDCGSSSMATKAALQYASAIDNQCGSNKLRPGVIGPSLQSSVAAAARILRAVDVPIVSPTASINSDQNRNSDVLRILPSTSHQAKVLVDLTELFGWDYVTLIATRGEYGESGADETRRLAEEKGICTSAIMLLDDLETDSAVYDEMITTLVGNIEAKGVVLWCSSNNVDGLLGAIQRRQGAAYDLVLLTSDSALSNITLFESYPNAASGLISIRSYDWSNNEATLNYLKGNSIGTTEFDNPATYPTTNALLSYLNCLSAIHQDKCGGVSGLCPAMASMSSQDLSDALKTNVFPLISQEDFTFDKDGQPSDFTIGILQYQNDTSGAMNIKQVGTWKPDSGLLLMGTFQHYTQTGLIDGTPMSTCGTLCPSCSATNSSQATPSSNIVPTQNAGPQNGPGGPQNGPGGGNEPMEKNRGDYYMRVAGDLDIPVLLSISEAGGFESYDGFICGRLDEHEVLTTEALIYALDQVNSDPKILPGLKLGITVMDSCQQSVIATRQLTGVLGQTANLEVSGPTLGVIGPDTDDVAQKVVTEITEPAGLVTVSHGNTPSVAGSPNFFQTSPSLDEQARAIASLLTELDWFYVGIIYSDSVYGTTGYNAFVEAASQYGICLGPADKLPQNPMQPDFDSILFNMYQAIELNVIVTFVDHEYDARRLLATQRLYGFNRFSWVGTEKWGTEYEFEGFEDQASGTLLVIPSSGDLTDFQRYLSGVSVADAVVRNPWLPYVLGEIFPCGNSTRHKRSLQNILDCADLGPSGLATLVTMGIYNNDIFHSVNALYALAYSTDQLRQSMCNESDVLCAGFIQAAKGANFYDVVGNVSFASGGQQFRFLNRSGPPSFGVQNFQFKNDSGIQLVNIGTWSESTNLTLNANLLNLANPTVERAQRNPVTCGFCFGGAPIIEPLEILEWELEGVWVTMVLAASASCLLLIACTTVLFICNFNHPVVTAVDLSICLWLLLGLTMMYLMNFAYMVHANTTICAIRRVGTALAYAVTYSALSVKSIRFNRLVRGNPGDSMSFMGSGSQTFLFCVFLAGQLFIAAAWLLLQPPNANAIPGALIRCMGTENLWSCDYTHLELIVSLSYVYALALFVFFSSMGSVKYAYYESEGRFLHITSLINVAILIAWACVYTLADQSIAIPALCIGNTADATIILAATFLPKCGVIGKNVKKDPLMNHKPEHEGVVNQIDQTTNF